MRRGLPYLIALALGVGAALLVACGASTRGGIPTADASDIKRRLEEVRARVSAGRCEGLSSELRRVNTAIDNLPRSVDNRLVSALRDGADRLQSTAIQDCNDNSAPTQTETVPPEATPTQTETLPPETTPTQTETLPPETTTEPPSATVAPVPPPEPAPVPPPANPGGGTPPVLP